MSVTHRIRRQRWQVTAASAADAFAVRSMLRRENELSLLPALESAFAVLDDGEREIHVSRLDVSIRISSLERLAEELPVRLAEAARQALSEAVTAEPQMSAASRHDLTEALGVTRRTLYKYVQERLLPAPILYSDGRNGVRCRWTLAAMEHVEFMSANPS